MVLHRSGVPDLSMVYVVDTADIVGFLARFPVDLPDEWVAKAATDMSGIDFSKEWGQA